MAKDQLHSGRRAIVQAIVSVTAVLLMSLCGCSEGKRPIAQARVCLSTAADVSEFAEQIGQIGRSNGMTYFDRTVETRAEDQALESANGRLRKDGFVMNLGVRRSDGLGVAAGELPGPGYQVGLGFSGGKDEAEAQRFATSVIENLRRHWQVDQISGDVGVEPAAHCP